VRTILNLVWLILAGFWLAIAYALAGLLLCITIMGIPFGVQSFKLAGYALRCPSAGCSCRAKRGSRG
jgi:uncharacterized membrane protein YccF (DUF307 family)